MTGYFLLVLIGKGEELGRVMLNIIGCLYMALRRFAFPLLPCKNVPSMLSSQLSQSYLISLGGVFSAVICHVHLNEREQENRLLLYSYCLWVWLQQEKRNQDKRYLTKYYVIILF